VALQPLELLVSGWKQQLEARGAWRRLNERRSPSQVEPPLSLPTPSGRLDIERVVFGHEAHRPALIKGAQFSIAAGESLGLIGPSASGKTTLARLLLGIWRPQSGTVRLDGADIGQWDRDALGAHLGYLPQDVELFAGTVAENVARLGPVDDERVVAAGAAGACARHDPAPAEGLRHADRRRRLAPLGRPAPAHCTGPRAVRRSQARRPRRAEREPRCRRRRGTAAALQTLKARGTTVVVVGHRPALMASLDKIAVLQDGAVVAFAAAAALLPQLAASAAPAQRKPGPSP
jgi:ABC-type protease/lipase transport system fused ATPase/permease subunit